MRVKLAHISGFCDGVKRAMRIALTGAKRHGGLQSAGPLVHNRAAVELLALHGIAVNSHENSDKPMLVRAHGVPPESRAAWLDQGLTLVDATCVHVARNQRLVAEAAARGALVLIAGDADHAEVRATAACAGPDCRVVASARDIEELGPPSDCEAFLLAQTTFNVDVFAAMEAALRQRGGGFTVKDTICRATHDRQREARRLADACDAVVVVGGADSANTRRLAEAVRSRGKPAFLVETADDLRREDFAAFATVGVTSGASTPGWLTQEVVNRLRPWGKPGLAGSLRYAFALLAQSRVLTALCAAGLALAAQFYLLGETLPFLAAAGAGYVFFAHTLNRRTPVYEQARRWSSADNFYRRRRPAMLVLAWLGAGAALAGAALSGGRDFLLFATAVSLTILYARLSRGLSDGSDARFAFATLRNWVMAFGWAALLAGPPALEAMSLAGGLGAGLWIFLICLGGTLIIDLHDVASDRLMGIGTLPAQLGQLPAGRLARVALVLAAALSVAAALTLAWRGVGVGALSVFTLATAAVPVWGLWLQERLRRRPVQDAVWLQAAVDCMGIAAGVMAWGAELWA